MNQAATRIDAIPGTRQTVHFASGPERCEAWLYLPATPNGQRPPVIVMAHGLGAVKSLRLPAFAERFQAAGYACLVFDYRYFGGSTGLPRELLDIGSQLEDWRAAVAYVRSLPNVDAGRVIVWGTSFGGGHALVTAAEDSRIVAAVAQCPFTDGPASVRAIAPLTNAKVTALALQDVAAQWRGKEPVRVKVAGEPGEVALMTAADALPGYYALITSAGLTEIRDRVPARIALQIIRHRPGKKAKDVRCPILFSVCWNDSVAPAGPTLRYAAQAPRGEVKVYRDGHFEIYLGEAFERVVGDQLAFLRRHVPSVG